MTVTDELRPETRARLRYVRQSPTKVRQVLALIRGKSVEDARRILKFSDRLASEAVLKLLDSAIANAEHNDNLPTDELFVQTAFADEAPVQKRFRPRARGRGTRILKRVSHITIGVARLDDDELQIRTRAEEASGGGATARRQAAQRQRRVEQSRKAQREAAREAEHDHDHDHEGHDHDHEGDDVEELDTVDAETDLEAEAGTDDATEAGDDTPTDADDDTDAAKDDA